MMTNFEAVVLLELHVFQNFLPGNEGKGPGVTRHFEDEGKTYIWKSCDQIRSLRWEIMLSSLRRTGTVGLNS